MDLASLQGPLRQRRRWPRTFFASGAYSWIAFIGVTVANALVWRHRALPHIARKPELREGYKRLVLGLMLWGNIPWLVMGLGLLVGSVSSFYDYLRPREARPWVLAWYATCIGV